MLYFFAWVILTFVVAALGSQRKIGGLASFFISLIFSPLVGILVVLSSTKLSDVAFQKELLVLSGKKEEPQKDELANSAQEIEHLYQLWKKDILTEAEYLNKKQKILNRN